MKVDKPLYSTSKAWRKISDFGCCDYMRDRRTSEVSLLLSAFLKLISIAGPQREPQNQKVMQEYKKRGEYKSMISRFILWISCLYFILMMN